MQSKLRGTGRVIVLGTSSLVVAGPVAGLQINVTYTEFAMQQPHPADPTGAELTRIVEAAAQYYMDRIGDSHTLDLTIGWAAIQDDTDSPIPGPLAAAGVLNQSGRISTATITFDTSFDGDSLPWFFDPTPGVDDEFAMNQILYRDLGFPQQAAGYNGSVPDVLEVGYFGDSTAPSSTGRIDLLTVALHEIGHTLGYHPQLDTTATETADGDYDTPPNMLSGVSVGLLTVPGDVAHLAATPSLMCAGANCVSNTYAGRRIRPSAADLFGIATVSSFTDLRLERKDFVGSGTVWHAAGNWEGNRLPAPNDDLVGVRHGGVVVITPLSPIVVSTLIIDNASELIALADLSVTQSLTIDGQSSIRLDAGGSANTTTVDFFSSLDVTGGTYSSPTVLLRSQGEITVDGGTLDNNSFLVESGSVTVDGGTLNAKLIDH